MHSSIRLAIVALLVSSAPAAAAAQASTPDADLREVQAYRLTMPKLKQLNQAFLELRKQQEADPAYQALLKKKKELAALGEKEEPTAADQARMEKLEEEIAAAEEAEDEPASEDQSLSGMAARMSADPRISGALKRAGLAPREAATMQMALLQVAFAVGFFESGTIKEMPKDVSPENVKFYQANKAEIATLTALGEQKEE